MYVCLIRERTSYARLVGDRTVLHTAEYIGEPITINHARTPARATLHFCNK